ncbi:hypothetical protein AAG906_035910 [Vitis piasezkii]
MKLAKLVYIRYEKSELHKEQSYSERIVVIELLLQGNKLTGPAVLKFLALRNLQGLVLAHNQLAGTVLVDLGLLMPNLAKLDFPNKTNSAQHSYLYLFLAGLPSSEGSDPSLCSAYCATFIFLVLKGKLVALVKRESTDKLLGKQLKGTPSINFATFGRSLLRMKPLDILSVTENFNRNNIIGDGGRLNRRRLHGDWEFLAEMGTVGKVKHENLAPLLGCCILEDERFIRVYGEWKS